jgi:hypothetical protein
VFRRFDDTSPWDGAIWPAKKIYMRRQEDIFFSSTTDFKSIALLYYPFLGTLATSGVFSFFFFSNSVQASKHSGTKTSSGFPPLADQ